MRSPAFWLIALFIIQPLARADDCGEAILRNLDRSTNTGATRTVVRQTIQTSGGDERAFQLRVLASSSSKEMLVVYTGPARVKGISFLMLNGQRDTWTYSPKTRRVRKLTSSTKKRKVNGSDFTYEDFALGGGHMTDDFNASCDGEELIGGHACDRLVLLPKPGGPSYSKVVAWIGRDPRVLRQADYYDSEGKAVKRLTATDIRLVDGIPTPHRLRMQRIQGSQSTLMELLQIEHGVAFSTGTFTLDNLQRQ
jgi:hypothetical protein